MNRNVTSTYRTYATADLVRRELTDFGISSSDIHVVPDTEISADTAVAEGTRNDDRYIEQLHDLHLPDDDLRMYQQCVRRGDYVVSVEIDEDKVVRVQEIMRLPENEAYNLDSTRDEFGDAAPDPHTGADDRSINEDRRADRDPDHTDPYTRSYRRN